MQGYAGPGLDLEGVELTVEQRALCEGGLSERQLKMLKAQVTMVHFLKYVCFNPTLLLFLLRMHN